MNREKFLLVYSTAHVGDIRSSITDIWQQKQHVIDDLDYISKITDGLCLSNDSKNVNLGFYDPGELLDGLLESETLLEDFSIDSIFKSMEVDEVAGEMIRP